MTAMIAFWNILLKDMRTYYLKPPNISWGIIFPLAWTGMFLIKSGGNMADIPGLIPGIVAVSILFGTTSMLAVTVTFEKRNRSFERLLLAPVSFYTLMLAKTGGAFFFGVVNAFVPVVMAFFFTGLPPIAWGLFTLTVCLISATMTFLGLLIAISSGEVFEAQTYSNFFRFPMIFLCGLFFPVSQLPWMIRPLSYCLPLTYGADVLHATLSGVHTMPVWSDIVILTAFCLGIFLWCMRSVQRKWIR